MSYTGGYEAVRMHNIRATTHNISAMQRARARVQRALDLQEIKVSQRAQDVADLLWLLERGNYDRYHLLRSTRIPTYAAEVATPG